MREKRAQQKSCSTIHKDLRFYKGGLIGEEFKRIFRLLKQDVPEILRALRELNSLFAVERYVFF
jgi:hypothetical protein